MAYTHLSEMMCGGCGTNTFKIFFNSLDRHDTPKQLFVECSHCRSVTEVSVSDPRLQLSWGEKSDGVLCPSGK